MVEATDTLRSPDQALRDYRRIYSLVSGNTLMAYAGFGDSDQAVRRNKAIWLQKYEDVAKQEPSDFTTIDLLYSGKIDFGEFSVDFGSWRKPKKEYSGDLVYAKFMVNDPNNKGALLGVCADGATMLVKAEDLPQKVREVCTYQTPTGPVFAPDHLWSAFMSRVFFLDNRLPVAPEFQELIDTFLKSSIINAVPFGAVYEDWYTNHEDEGAGKLWEMVFESCQANLREFYSFLFGEEFLSDKSVAGLLPSGVMSVFKLEEDGAFDYGYTGDVDIAKIKYAHQFGPVLQAELLTTEEVSSHDQALDLTGRDQKNLVRIVATERIVDTGNITGVMNVVPKIGHTVLGASSGVILRTDGERLVWKGQLGGAGGTRRSLDSSGGDVGAVLLFTSPEFYQMDLIATQRRWRRRREDKYDREKAEFKRKWRADDASFIRIRRNT